MNTIKLSYKYEQIVLICLEIRENLAMVQSIQLKLVQFLENTFFNKMM